MLEKLKNLKAFGQTKYKDMRAFFKVAYNKHIIYMYIVISILLNLGIEMMARGSVLKGIYFLIASPYIFICYAFIILMTLSFTLRVRRRFFGIGVVSVIWIIFGISNAVLLANRVTPFTAVDLMLIDSALGVMNKYFSTWQFILVGIGIVLAVCALIYLFVKAPKVNHKIKYVRNIIAIGLVWAIGMGALELGVASELIPTKFGNLRTCYNDYGFVYCFSNSLVNTGVSKPSDYSDKTINKIVEDKTNSKKVKKKPNIIFLQLESFFDLKKITNIQLSKDPIPNFTQLKEAYPSGYLNVPIVGAGTVNTEFEVMTGMNLDDFGPGEYPFKTILKDKTCESICFNLKNYGYKCHAIHNNTATFYSRNVVFSNLGYDTFTSIENMNIDDFTPMGWAKDYFLTEKIISSLKSTKKQDFIYTISVQGHGSYPTDGDYDYPIKVTGLDDEAMTNQYQYYAWQISEMDAFVGQLIEELNKLGEDTILVMYGDHLPSLGITAENLMNGDVYQTEYIIWSNYDTKYANEDIEAYQLESKILKKLNMTAGDINNYTQKHKNEDSEEDYLDGLHNLEYDQLYGENLATNGTNPYVASDLKFGLHEVKVNSVSPLYDDMGTVYIYGKYFTSYSKVYINEEKQKTVYLDPNTLMITYPELREGDSISVYQQNSDTHVLTQTEPYVFVDEGVEDSVNKNRDNPAQETTTASKNKKSKKKNKNKK